MFKLQTKSASSFLLALLFSTSLTACAGVAPPKTVSDGCLIFKPLTYANAPVGQVDDPGNKFDTPDTIKQIDEHDAVYESLCPQKP